MSASFISDKTNRELCKCKREEYKVDVLVCMNNGTVVRNNFVPH